MGEGSAKIISGMARGRTPKCFLFQNSLNFRERPAENYKLDFSVTTSTQKRKNYRLTLILRQLQLYTYHIRSINQKELKKEKKKKILTINSKISVLIFFFY